MKKLIKIILLCGIFFAVMINLPKTVFADTIIWADGSTTEINYAFSGKDSAYKFIYNPKNKKEFGIYLSNLANNTGRFLTGFATPDSGKTYYYLDKTTKRAQYGIKKIDGYWYYFGTDGKMKTNYKYNMSSTDSLYFDYTGKAVNMDGLYKVNNSTTYCMIKTLNGYSKIAYGWQKLNNHWYYFNKVNGVMATSWQLLNGDYYYFDSYGKLFTNGIKTISGKTYYFDSNGIQRSGWHKVNNKWYYFNEGKDYTSRCSYSGWLDYNTHRYY